jgi:hypothetical protein
LLEIFKILERLLNLSQDIVLDAGDIRITVSDNPPPEFLGEKFSKFFNFLAMESDDQALGELLLAIAEKRGVDQYFRAGRTNKFGMTRVVLACPTNGRAGYPLVLTGQRSIFANDERFRERFKEFPAKMFLTVIEFNIKFHQMEFIWVIGAVNAVIKASDARSVTCYQKGNKWFLVVGTDKSMAG